jgi:hypothetical protein
MVKNINQLLIPVVFINGLMCKHLKNPKPRNQLNLKILILKVKHI